MYFIKRFNFEKADFEEWNLFIQTTSLGHFFFQTDYLFYHKERFTDFSLLIYNEKKVLICVVPACLKSTASINFTVNFTEKILYSHQGLTFGGFIFKDKLPFLEKQKCISACLDFLKENNFTSLIIKPLPSYFLTDLNREDSLPRLLYNGILKNKVWRVEANSIIPLPKNELEYQQITYPNYSKRKKRNLQKASKSDLKVEKTELATDFWTSIEENLKKHHGILPVHSAEEIQLLQTNFNQNIYFFVVKDAKNAILASCVAFVYQTCIHLQYMAATPKGREKSALDFMIDEFIKNYPIYFDKNSIQNSTYLSLGVSERRDNKGSINEGLFKWKEEFGSKVFSHFVYQILL